MDRPGIEGADGALLAAYLLVAALGTWTQCLLVNDGAVYLAAAWLGNAWDLFFDQNTARAVSTFFQFGLAWAVRPLFGSASTAFMLVSHALYFAGPLVLWSVLRSVEPARIYSRLYLAVTLMMIYFTSEMVAGIGLWLIWLAIMADPFRSRRAKAAVTILVAPLLAFAHPGIALLSLLFAVVGGGLGIIGRPFPRVLAIAAAAMGLVLLAAFFALSAAFHSSNPTIAAQQGLNKYDYIDPLRLLRTLVLFPMLGCVWLMLLLPGLGRRPSRPVIAIVAALGLWFAAAGTGLLTWLYARHTAPHVLAIALALALASPAAWLVNARLPLKICAAIAAVAALSYTADLMLFGRFVDRHLQAGVTDVDAVDGFWPPPLTGAYGDRGTFKWAAGADYQRDVVVPVYDWYQVTLAFYSYFRSERLGILFHPLAGHAGAWIPFTCGPIDRASRAPHDERDRQFLAFLTDRYCVR
jgi:hypothetical protein